MFLDELASRFDFITHQYAEHFISGSRIGQFDFDHGTVMRIEGSFAEFFGVHFTETFKAGDGQSASSAFSDRREKFSKIFDPD
jgi:hypothetical protein